MILRFTPHFVKNLSFFEEKNVLLFPFHNLEVTVELLWHIYKG